MYLMNKNLKIKGIGQSSLSHGRELAAQRVVRRVMAEGTVFAIVSDTAVDVEIPGEHPVASYTFCRGINRHSTRNGFFIGYREIRNHVVSGKTDLVKYLAHILYTISIEVR
jgi:hypothetical protein